MAHPNARLTPATRLELVLEVEAGWSQAEVARRFRVSRPTVSKWWRRYREEGAAGLRDRTSAPRSNPRRTAAALEQRICAVRRSQGFGPHRIAWALGIARSTAYAVLRRFGLNRLDRLHRVTRRQLRYEHPAPRRPAAYRREEAGPHPRGRWAPRPWALRRDSAHPRPRLPPRRRRRPQPLRLRRRPARRARPQLRRLPRAGAWPRSAAVACACAACSPTTRRPTPSPGDFRGVAAAAGVALRHTRPYRPQTNGKAERFIQTLQNEWAYARPYRSNAERLHQLPRWLYRYNARRPHGGIGGAVPASRL